LNIGGWITGAAGAITVPGSLTTAGFTSTGIDDNATTELLQLDATNSIVRVGDVLNTANTQLHFRQSAIDGNHYIISYANTKHLAIKNQDAAGDLYFSAGATEKMRIDSAGDVTVTNGNLVIGTSGKGIDFSATPDGSGSTGSEVLDDYEEGTWTAYGWTTYGWTPGTVSDVNGKYVKIGKMVTISLTIGSFGSSETVTVNDRLRFLGLPYNVAYSPAGVSGGGFVGAGHIYNSLGGGVNAQMMVTPWGTNEVWCIVNTVQGSPLYNNDAKFTATYMTN